MLEIEESYFKRVKSKENILIIGSLQGLCYLEVDSSCPTWIPDIHCSVTIPQCLSAHQLMGLAVKERVCFRKWKEKTLSRASCQCIASYSQTVNKREHAQSKNYLEKTFAHTVRAQFTSELLSWNVMQHGSVCKLSFHIYDTLCQSILWYFQPFMVYSTIDTHLKCDIIQS